MNESQLIQAVKALREARDETGTGLTTREICLQIYGNTRRASMSRTRDLLAQLNQHGKLSTKMHPRPARYGSRDIRVEVHTLKDPNEEGPDQSG